MDTDSPPHSHMNSNVNVGTKRSRDLDSEYGSFEYLAYVTPSHPPNCTPKITLNPPTTVSNPQGHTPPASVPVQPSSLYKQVLTGEHLETQNWPTWTLPEVRLPPLHPPAVTTSPQDSMPMVDIDEDLWKMFQQQADYDKVLRGDPWMIARRYLLVRQWSPSFSLFNFTLTSLLVWLRITDLPLEFFHREILHKIGTMVGRVVKIDVHTEMITRGRFARLCVELDISKPLLPRVSVIGIILHFQYEGIPSFCYACGRLRHAKPDCTNASPDMAIS